MPVVFDFEKPTSRTTDETITLLARMARFVIADISDAKSALQELRGIVPDNPTLPVQTIIIADQEEPGMFDFFKRYPWFLEAHRYASPADLLSQLSDRVIDPVGGRGGEASYLGSRKRPPVDCLATIMDTGRARPSGSGRGCEAASPNSLPSRRGRAGIRRAFASSRAARGRRADQGSGGSSLHFSIGCVRRSWPPK